MTGSRSVVGQSAVVAAALGLALAGWLRDLALAAEDAKPSEPGHLALASDATAEFRFSGPIGERIDANVSGWLMPCPRANPGLLEMFRVRDRQPVPQVVPWAGEFVGKYLISAIQTLRMVDDPALERQVSAIVAEVCKMQDEDGYLGPFPRDQRLLGQWDLWGHYHVMLALLMWHERLGDKQSLDTCLRAADLMGRTYLDGDRRVFDAGSHEMNMAVIHVLGHLYRLTEQPRYRLLMSQIEADWERTGDYFRTGLAGEEFFRSPRPRWESLHDLQGLVELYRITGDERYRQAFLHHWASIRRWDRRNSGAFSSGEQATGNPYEATAIETCCTVAWMAVSLDALQLTANSLIADELELSTFNAACGAQHPSGRWWTYNTPMDGTREASAHSIVFQARAGTPELNCCSVNGPRSLGMLSEWALMRTGDALAINYYGPMEARTRINHQLRLRLVEETSYPRDGHVVIRLADIEHKDGPASFTLRLRIPGWSRSTSVTVNGQSWPGVRPGCYLDIQRVWQTGDKVELDLDMRLRHEAGDLDAAGSVSLYRGPLLLAFDPQDNDFDAPAIGTIDVQQLDRAVVSDPRAAGTGAASFPDEINRPWVLVDLPLAGERLLRLRDFASAGSAGTSYRTWLKAEHAAPPALVAWLPADGSAVPAGRILFTWRRPASTEKNAPTVRVVITADAAFTKPLIEYGNATSECLILPVDEANKLAPGETYHWKVVASNEHGETESVGQAKSFCVDPKLPPLDDAALLTPHGERADGIVVEAPLVGNPTPSYGKLAEARGWQTSGSPDNPTAGAVELDGKTGLLRYTLQRFPADSYTLAVRCRFAESGFDSPRIERCQQVASAWCRAQDDPLRLCLDHGKLFARIEAGNSGFSTEGVPVEPARWYHLAAVKDGPRLRLFIDGQMRAEALVPATLRTVAPDLALGGNPHFSGDEYLAARLADFRLYARALTADEVRSLAEVAPAAK